MDTEGYDAQILRSVIQHCKGDKSSWPQLIQFESMGHGDSLEGAGTEWHVIDELHTAGYRLIAISNYDTVLVRKETLYHPKKSMSDWLGAWQCDHCNIRWCFPYHTDHGCRCWRCLDRERWGKKRRMSRGLARLYA